MRKSVSPSYGKTAARLLVAALLASAATGCSSDVSRFGGVFSSSDSITTNSVPRRTLFGSNPVPRGDIAGSGQVVPVSSADRDTALNQPFPGQDSISRDPISASTNTGSGARLASTPVIVERQALADPSLDREREEALSQPLPAARQVSSEQMAAIDDTRRSSDAIVTGTVQARKAGWSAENGPVVMLRQGETVQALSRRFGVPEKEILKANGLERSADAQPGQKIIIPTFSVGGSAARASADATIDTDGRIPVPERKSGQDVAILPSGAASRDKGADDNAGRITGKGQPKAGPGGVYEVQPGDTLTKIARKAGVSVDALKQANGLDTASIRIGQKLVLPGADGQARDATVTASVPEGKKPVSKAEKKAEVETKPVETASVTTADIGADVTEAAPESTGISKYRWPVRGAVVAGYGANVDGNRNDGIDISVPEGTPIKAAENGVVIYSGSSLKELGNAVLVRHDDGTVTVYGHAGELNVQRGQKVQRGQTLASSGMSGNTSRPKVHFEVRKNATPVDPMTYLE